MMKCRKKFWKILFLLLCLFFFIIMPAGQIYLENQKAPYIFCRYKNLTGIFKEAFPQYEVTEEENSFTRNIVNLSERGNLSVCSDVEAMPIIKEFPEFEFVPLFKSGVVFAVDRSKTGKAINSWQDIADAELKTGLMQMRFHEKMILPACAYALEGDNFSIDSAVEFFRSLHRRGLLKDNFKDSDIMICFEHEAVQMQREYPCIETVIPKDGTLLYTIGILGKDVRSRISKESIDKLSVELNGLKLEDRDDFSAEVTDFQHFSEEIRNITGLFKRKVLSSRLLSPVDGRENIIVIAVVLIMAVLWSCSALYRSPGREIFNCIMLISVQIILWLVTSLYKYMMHDTSLINRILWYSYYVFLMGIPLTLLYMAVILDKPEGKDRAPAWFKPLPFIYLLLFAMVATNDFHNFVFIFDLNGHWASDYSYGIGYYMIFTFCLLVFLSATGILFFKTKKSPKRYSVVLPFAIAVLMIGYNLGYINGVPLIADSNYALTFCLLAIFFAEAMLNAGLIPNNKNYRMFFRSAPLNMQILDADGNRYFSNSEKNELSPEEVRGVLSSHGRDIYKDADTLLHVSRITGGFFVWQEDISRVNRLNEALNDSIQKAERSNAILQKKNDLSEEKINEELRQSLFDQMEANIKDDEKELSVLIKNLPSGDERKKYISFIPLQLCHIKRLCNLFFISQERETMSSNELAVYLDELSEFASYANIRSLVRCGVSGEVGIIAAKLCYNFYFAFLSSAKGCDNSTLIGMMRETDGYINFDILQSEKSETEEFSESFCRDMKNAGASVLPCNSDDTNGTRLVVPKNGREAD